EEQNRVPALERRARDQKAREQHGTERENDIRPPALRDRVEAIDQLAELRLDKRPAGPARAETGFAAVAGPDRVEKEETQQRRHDERDQEHANHGHHDIEPAGKEVLPHPAYRP